MGVPPTKKGTPNAHTTYASLVLGHKPLRNECLSSNRLILFITSYSKQGVKRGLLDKKQFHTNQFHTNHQIARHAPDTMQ